ncbi:uncharacterized protein LOC125023213 [Mugil cephalus]|uniref:uncharacterized protein LOC125023213 n=1 Tax=Mugil cephalus TaxID=48193 RepID=UPI001FB794E9|nr:uncharacterized protein LOC125023213 [Mugil cephalus]
MTKPKTKPCPSCQAPNACNRKTCSACLGSLDVKVKLRKKQEKVKNSDWAASIRKNRNSSRVVHSAQLSVFKLHALGYQPVLFLCQCDRKGRIIGDLITHIQPAGGAAHEILMEMRKLYEDLLSDPDPDLDPDLDPDPDPDLDPDPAPDQEAPNEEFILHSEPVPTSSSLLPPTSSSLCPLPPGPSYPSPLPPTSFYPSPLPAPPSVSAVYTSDVPTRKRKRKECRKHHTQQIFLYEAMVDRSVVDGKEEVKVKWKPCSTWSSGPGGDWRRL